MAPPRAEVNGPHLAASRYVPAGNSLQSVAAPGADVPTTLLNALRRLPPLETAKQVALSLHALVEAGALDLPLPGAGHTRERFDSFRLLGAHDLSLTRLAEGHADALAILAEAGVRPQAGPYGVWAAEPPSTGIVAERVGEAWQLRGRKRFASGASGLTRALVTAHVQESCFLFDVPVRHPVVRPVVGTWSAAGMADTDSTDVVFDGLTVPNAARIGDHGFYTSRPGFWHGAVGVAACWFGGALGAFAMLRRHLAGRCSDAHQLAHLGAVAARCAALGASMDTAARAIDADPHDLAGRARSTALIVRHEVEQGCQEVLARVGRASGTSPLVFDRAHARRAADLPVYLRQHHAERDSESLGKAVLEDEAWRSW